MKSRFFYDPVMAGLIIAILSVGLGLAYMQIGGAPVRMLAMNSVALLIGFVLVILVRLSGNLPEGIRSAAPIFAGTALLATAGLTQPVDGAARWTTIGAITIQPSLIVLPAVLVSFARKRTQAAAIGVALSMVAMAGQPDRAMAAMAVTGASIVLFLAPDRRGILWLVPIAFASFLIAMARPDRLPASPYVDQILYSAPALGAFAGLAVIGGSLLLLTPALFAITVRDRLPLLVFGGVWCTALAAAALGNYPTPLVGYGGSAILGYCVSVAMLRELRTPAAAADQNIVVKSSDFGPPSGLAMAGAPND